MSDEVKYLKERVEKLEKILAKTLDLLGRYDEYYDSDGYGTHLICNYEFLNLGYELEDSLNPYKMYKEEDK